MGEKASLNLEKRYRLWVFRKNSYTWKIKNHPQLSLNSMINSLEFFLLLLYFLNLSFSLFFFGPLFLWIPIHVIYHDFCTILTVHVWIRVFGASPYPISHLLESSTTSCKATDLLFRHHLYINTARELVGKHLMWR